MNHYRPGSRHEAVKKAWVTRKKNAGLNTVTDAITSHAQSANQAKSAQAEAKRLREMKAEMKKNWEALIDPENIRKESEKWSRAIVDSAPNAPTAPNGGYGRWRNGRGKYN